MDAIPAWCEVASKLRSGHSLNRTSPGTLRLRRLAAPVLGQTWGQGAPCCTSRCAPTRAAPFESLTTWLSGRGGAISDLGLEPCELPGGAVVRGLVATAHHEAGDTLMSVPLGAALRDDAAPEPYPGAPWNACLAALLLQERARGRDSAWAPYLATLPGCQDCDDTGLLLLPDDMLSELQYAPAAAALAAYRTTVASAHAATAAQWHGHGACPGWREWAWATHMVQSRSIRLAIAGCRVMIPGIDLLNHGGAAANGSLALGRASWAPSEEPAVCFVASQRLEPGQQVLWSYGTRGNDDFLAYHGFVLPDNPDEDVLAFNSAEHACTWCIQYLPGLGGLTCASTSSSSSGPAALRTAAEAAAVRAAAEAGARCSSAAIQGTSSSLMVKVDELLSLLAAELDDAGAVSGRQQQQQTEQQYGANRTGPVEAALLRALRRATLTRRLASFRLHTPEWGTPACVAAAPELALRGDGGIDVRLPAVLAALLDASAASPATLLSLLRDALRCRCEQLLHAFPSSIEDDEKLLLQLAQQQQQQHSVGEFGLLMPVLVQYRMGKKRALLQQLRGLDGR